MSDTSLNKYVAQGDDAAEAAFTPDPVTGTTPEQAVLFVNSENPAAPELKWWDGSNFIDVAGGGGGGNVNAGGTLTANQLVIGAGSTDVAALGSLGTTTTVLHGNAGGAPTFGAIVTNDIQDEAVTLAKIADAAANDKLLGSGNSGSGNPYAEISLGSGLSMSGTTLSATGGGAVGDLLDVVYIRKPSIETVTNSTAYISDANLNVPIGASEEWIIEWHLILTGHSSGDFKFALNVPSGATGYMSIVSGLVSSATATSGNVVLTATTDLTDTANFVVATVTGSITTATIRGIIVNSTNAGTVTLRWSQGAMNGTGTSVNAMSYVVGSRYV